MRGVLAEIRAQGVPAPVTEELGNALDCNIYFFDHKVEILEMYGILAVAAAILLAVYILLNALRKNAH